MESSEVEDLRRQLAAARAQIDDLRVAEAASAQIHEALLAETHVLRVAQGLSRVGSWSYDVRTGETTWSEELHRIYGTVPGEIELTPTTYLETMPPEDAARMRALAEETVRTGEPYATEFRVLRADGQERFAQARGHLELDVDGTPLRFNGTTQDVTERLIARRELTAARDLLAQLLSAATEQAVIGFDTDRRVTIFNRGAERMLGYTAHEMVGTKAAPRLHTPSELPSLTELFEQVISGADPTAANRRWTYVRKDGSQLRVRLVVSVMRGPDGEITGYLAIATDVSEQLRAERERDGNEQMLRAIVDNNQSMIYVKDLHGRYLLVNRAFERAHGRSARDVVGHTVDELHPEQTTYWKDAVQRAMTGPHHTEEEVLLPSGRHVFEAVRLPLYDADGQVYAICGISLDITERREAELGAQRAMVAMGEARDRALAANAGKNAFLATMSHEIRTPMNAVIGLSGLLLDTRLDDEQHDLAATVRNSGEHLMTIINDILDFSKVEAGELDLEARPFELREFATRTVNRFADRAAALHLRVEVEDDVPLKVVGDDTRLRQVLGNLVDNAVKFTTEGGVLIRIDLDEDPHDPEQDVLRFDVRDTGIGIAPQDVERLFQPFTQVDGSTTRTYGGTGLGLAICRGIVEAMGGRLWAESEPGAGSVFSFTVPLGRVEASTPAAPPHVFEQERTPAPASSSSSSSSSDAPAPVLPAQGGTLRILLVEDNEVNQKVGTMMLAKLGHSADIAQNGELALQAARAVRYDVVLMDMHMPVMDGLESTRRIRAEVPPERQPYIVAVTASVTREDREACAAAGMNAYIPKPIQIDELAAVLGDFSSARAAAHAAQVAAATHALHHHTAP